MKNTIGLVAVLAGISSISLGQSFFNRTVVSFQNGSARSAAMGYTGTVSDRSSGLLLSNPAGLAGLSGAKVDLQAGGVLLSESRSMDMMDTFGDFLTSGDYALNRNRGFSGQGGFVYGTQLAGLQAGLGASYGQLTNFDYNYKEEVRGRLSPDDGVIDNRDPLLGYHVYNTSGNLNHVSFGGAVQFNLPNSFAVSGGFSYHYLPAGEFSEEFYVDTTLTNHANLAVVEEKIITSDFSSSGFYTLGVGLVTSFGLSLNFAMDSGFEVATDSSSMPGFSSNAGLPLYSSFTDGGKVVTYGTGLNQEIPSRKRVGVEFATVGEVDMTVAFEVQQTGSYDIELMADTLAMAKANSWKIGFEYMALKEIPVRAGLEFRESPFAAIGPTSIYTFGTGKQIGRFTFDLAGSYGSTYYEYPDLFPVEGDIRPDLDRVTESRIDLLLSVTYSL